MWRLVCCMALVLHFLTWFPSASRMLPPNNNVSSNQFGTNAAADSFHSPHSNTGKKRGIIKRRKVQMGEEDGVKATRLCGGCKPCEAIKVPTITSLFGLHSANYEPQSWKCKCGLLFYTP